MKNSLKTTREFDLVYKSKTKFYASKMAVFFRPLNNFKAEYKNDSIESRLGLSVSKKVGGSVLRNRLKRIFREIFREFAPKLERGDFVIMAKQEAANAEFIALKSEFYFVVNKLNLLQNRNFNRKVKIDKI